MKFRRDTGELTGWGRVTAGVATAAAGVGIAACTGRASAPETSASASGNVRYWPGTDPKSVHVGERLRLLDENCTRWQLVDPQPAIVRAAPGEKTQLLVVIEARQNYPPHCDQDVDQGAQTRSGASYTTPPVALPVTPNTSADGWIKDGTVVEVLGAEQGQYACSVDPRTGAIKGSNVWLKIGVADGQGGVTHAEIPEINAGYVGDQLALAGVALSSSVYHGTAPAHGC